MTEGSMGVSQLQVALAALGITVLLAGLFMACWIVNSRFSAFPTSRGERKLHMYFCRVLIVFIGMVGVLVGVSAGITIGLFLVLLAGLA